MANFSLKCEKLTDAVFVGFRGKEQISRPYEYEIFFTVPAGSSVREAVGERATIRGHRGDFLTPVVIHGVLANIRLLHQSGERALYGGLLVPRVWLLRHFWRSYVFTHKTLKQFVTDTLKDGGLAEGDFRFAIDDDAHVEEEFVTQYRETHLDFLHRWLEREGIYYFFEHDPDAESEVMVLVEDRSATVPFPGSGHVRYMPIGAGEASGVEGFNHLEANVSWLPKSVTIADYDYANPAVSLRSDSAVTSKGVGAIREYGYRAFVEGDLKRLAAVKAQAIGCRETTLRAVGNVLGPRAGYRVTIDDQPEGLEEEWLAVEVEVTGLVAGWTEDVGRLTGLTKKQVLETKLFAVPSSVQYRSPQTTPWPRIYGLENGVVSGPADSPYAQIDDDGRYLVRFEFDTSDLPDAKVSTRVRMLQPHGGSTEGMHFPLRKGTEVMIAFLGGDPDRPFIAGVVPNAHKPSVVGARNATQNIIRTGANNQIVMEDEQGKEFIFMHTPNQSTGIYMGTPAGAHASVYTGEDEDVQGAIFTGPASADPEAGTILRSVQISLYPHTEGNAGSYFGGNSWQEVVGTESIHVGGPTQHGYDETYELWIGGATTEKYFSTRTTFVKSGRTDTVAENGWTQNITNKLHQTVTGSGFQHVTERWKHDVDGENHDDYGSWKTDVEHGWTQTVGGSWNGKFANESVTIDATASDLKIHSGGQIAMDAPNLIHLKAAKVDCESTGIFNSTLAVKNETYLESGSLGAFKFDETGFAQAITGIKFETTGMAFERKGLVPKEYALTREAAGAALKQAGAKIKSTAADIWNGAFKKT